MQTARALRLRRALVLVVNVGTYVALVAVLGRILGTGGWSAVDVGLFAGFLIGAPWTVLGFWNAVLGLWLLHGVRDGLARVAPYAAAGEDPEPIRVATAVLMTIRNEDPARAMARLRVVKASLDRTGFGDRFGYFILSDTSDPALAVAEEAAVDAWRREASATPIVYRHRETNTGFKAGNLRDFCRRWGAGYDLMLPLDADSLMAGATIVRLVRMMQAYPQIGILQSLAVGMPSQSAFARIFQFGMRHGMRPYTMGAAWWTADCGPFWGHNALVRIAPFLEHCDLPVLAGGPPLGGHILSHDQLEAALMRRAGFEVRVLPAECGSWEENPPSILAFVQRDARWCQGNMQYWRLLSLPRLTFISRYQLAWAILMFLGVFAWTATIVLAPLKLFDGEDHAAFPSALAIGLYLAFQLMQLMPKLAGLVDVILTQGGVVRYGGALRFAAGSVVEVLVSYLLGAVVTLSTSIFMVGLFLGRSIKWSGQPRDVVALSWRASAARLWWITLFGIVIATALGVDEPVVLLWALPLIGGYLVAIPLAVVTASPAVGAFFIRTGLNGVPEDFDPPEEIRALHGIAMGRHG